MLEQNGLASKNQGFAKTNLKLTLASSTPGKSLVGRDKQTSKPIN